MTHVVLYFWDSNTTPGYTTLLCSALHCGNMYEIDIYCKKTYGGGGGLVVVWDFLIVIPLHVIQLYSALPWIVEICME